MKNNFIFIKKNIHCGVGDASGIPGPIEDGDGMRFLGPVGYG